MLVWLRRYGAETLAAANQVLTRYIRYYNRVRYHRELRSTPEQRFAARAAQSRFMPVGSDVDLGKIFSYRAERTVTFRFNGVEYQLNAP